VGSSYTISNCSGLSASNYTISYVYSTFSVTPASLTVTCPTFTITYGTPFPTLTPSYSSFRNNESPSVLSPTPTCKTTATGYTGKAGSGSRAGSYAVTASDAQANPVGNYNLTLVNGLITIRPDPLVIAAPDLSVGFGNPIPTLQLTYATFANGDTALSLSTQPHCATAATSASPAGTYATTCSGAVDANYSISYVAGTLTIAPAFVPKSVSLVGNVCSGFSQSFAIGVSGTKFSVLGGSGVPGLALSSAGVLSGTPTTAGTFVLTIAATEPTGKVITGTFDISIGLCIDGGNPLLPAASKSRSYADTLTAQGGTGPYRFQIVGGGLPPGMSLSQAGMISGTTGNSGTYTVTIEVFDSANPVHTGTQTLSLTVA
jgi:hypothetical protein